MLRATLAYKQPRVTVGFRTWLSIVVVSARGCPGSTCISPVLLEKCKLHRQLAMSSGMARNLAEVYPNLAQESLHVVRKERVETVLIATIS